MITIQRAVEEVLKRSPFYTEVLIEGLVNHAKLARRMRPQIKARLHEDVSEAAVAMALHRLEKKMQKPPVSGSRFLRELSDITVRSNLVEFIFSNSPELPGLHRAIIREIDHAPDTFVNIMHGLHESVVVVSKNAERKVERILASEKSLKKIDNLASISLRLPEASLAVPGVYYPILKALAWENINIVEVISVATELSIIFEDHLVDNAFAVIKRITS